jgi:hypothetical protein
MKYFCGENKSYNACECAPVTLRVIGSAIYNCCGVNYSIVSIPYFLQAYFGRDFILGEKAIN